VRVSDKRIANLARIQTGVMWSVVRNGGGERTIKPKRGKNGRDRNGYTRVKKGGVFTEVPH
jgi:hypothetical protein